MSIKQITIPQDFMLGAAASAWQTEGWSGKKPGQDSWIDLWYKNDRHVWHNGYGPAVATDFINRFREDVALMKQAGLTHYRTSINWSRFLTDYENATVDEEYAAYYDALFDEMHRQGIEPMICPNTTNCRACCWKPTAAGRRSTSSSCSFAMRKKCLSAFTAKSPAGLPSTSRLWSRRASTLTHCAGL